MLPFLLVLLSTAAPPPAVHASPIQSSPVVVTISPRKGTRRLLCSVDAGRSHACKRRSKFRLAPGRHTIAVRAVFAHHRTSARRTVAIVVPEPAPAAVHVGGQPVGIGTLGDEVWVSGGTSGDVSRIDSISRSVTAVVHTGGNLGSLAAAANGIWVSDFGDGTLIRIDPATRAITARIPVGGQPTGVSVSADGSVWVGNLNGYLTRIDPATNAATAKITMPSGVSMPLSARGLIWVGLQNGSVVSVDPSTNRLTGGPIVVDTDVDSLVDSPGGIWVSTFDGSVELLDPGARKVTTRHRLPSRGSGIALAGGSLWASAFDSSLVVRLDPATGILVGAVRTGTQPRESVAAGSYLWVLDQGDGAVTPIPLPPA